MKTRYMTEDRALKGIQRLLSAPDDLAASGAQIVRNRMELDAADAEYQALFKKYRKELKKVMSEAVDWWQGRVEVLTEDLGDAKAARLQNWRELPAGPASDPYVVAVIRKYWLACHALNDSMPKTSQIAPQEFLLAWVVAEGDDATAEILSGMPYWPIGLDRNGNWT